MENRAWKNRDKEKHVRGTLNWRMKRDYGITLDEYDEMFDKQSGLCLICKEPCNSGYRLAVDHNHATGKVRGLLCGKCNRGLGNFGDSILLLEQAIKYLKESA